MYTQIKTSEGTFVCKTDYYERAKEHLYYNNFEIIERNHNYNPSDKTKEYLEKANMDDSYQEDRNKQ